MASSPPHSIGVAVVCETVGHPRLNYDRSNASGVTSRFLTSTAPKFCVIDCSGIRRTSMRKATFFATALRLSGARRYARSRLHIVSCPDRLLRPLPFVKVMQKDRYRFRALGCRAVQPYACLSLFRLLDVTVKFCGAAL
jgi:hypothetical protein